MSFKCNGSVLQEVILSPSIIYTHTRPEGINRKKAFKIVCQSTFYVNNENYHKMKHNLQKNAVDDLHGHGHEASALLEGANSDGRVNDRGELPEACGASHALQVCPTCRQRHWGLNRCLAAWPLSITTTQWHSAMKMSLFMLLSLWSDIQQMKCGFD